MSQKCNIQQTKKQKLHESGSYFQKHVSSKRKAIGRPVIILNEYRAIGNTTQQYFWSQKFDIHQTTNENMYMSRIRISRNTFF